jgi:hypothetical protein
MTNHFPHSFFQSSLRGSVLIGLLSVTTLMSPSAFAAALGAQIGVSATVIANAVAKVERQVGYIEIEHADVARGYVDVPNATRFSVRTNSRNGYLMVFYPLLDIFESAQVTDANIRTNLEHDGGAIVHRDSLPADSMQSLSYRFYLNASVQPGTYPFPLQMQVRALDLPTLFVSD